MNKLQVAYFGTPQFSADFLEKIILDKDLPVEVVFVITQPDKKVGRKQTLTPSPVKLIAEKYKIPILTNFFPSFKRGGSRQRRETGNFIDEKNSSPSESEGTPLRKRRGSEQNSFNNLDLALLYAFGEIIPKDILEIPRLGFWNIHPSLLPKYRGASPLAYPLILGDTETGVSLIQMDEKMDHGPIITQEKLPISPTAKRPDLEIKLTDVGYKIFKNIINNYFRTDRSRPVPTKNQNHNLATFTSLLHKNDGFIPFQLLQEAIRADNPRIVPTQKLPKPILDYYERNHLSLPTADRRLPTVIYNLFRGLYPWPGIWTLIDVNHPRGVRSATSGVSSTIERQDRRERRLKITDMELKNNHLIIKKVQLEGKNEVDFTTFNKAYGIFKV